MCQGLSSLSSHRHNLHQTSLASVQALYHLQNPPPPHPQTPLCSCSLVSFWPPETVKDEEHPFQKTRIRVFWNGRSHHLSQNFCRQSFQTLECYFIIVLSVNHLFTYIKFKTIEDSSLLFFPLSGLLAFLRCFIGPGPGDSIQGRFYCRSPSHSGGAR